MKGETEIGRSTLDRLERGLHSRDELHKRDNDVPFKLSYDRFDEKRAMSYMDKLAAALGL